MGDAVELEAEEAADRPSHESTEATRVRVAVLRPRPGVADHQRLHQLGPAAGDAEADRASPTLHHQGRVRDLQRVEELFDRPAVRAREEVVPGGRLGEPEARVVEGDAAVLAAQLLHDVAVEERPGRVAVEEDDRLARLRRPLVEVMDARAVGQIDEVVRERVELLVDGELEPLRPRPRVACRQLRQHHKGPRGERDQRSDGNSDLLEPLPQSVTAVYEVRGSYRVGP